MKKPASDRSPVSLEALAAKAALLARLVNAAARSAASGAGLTKADADVLTALNAAPRQRLRPTCLATACGLSSGGTSNVILRLAQAGYVNREAHPEDGRSSWVRLTREGQALAGAVLESAARDHAVLLDRLPSGVADQLDELLDVALGHLQDRTAR
ncbi:MarR family transcriptional regulator [Streptomyces sp. NPDC006798]|uniref:MarR family winged helix-turn-helix transcriptional regulator n=1 Tax=Streptomyces sp. NPDC006798 TaxID=3155462 RepID=UPI0033CE3C85